METKVKVLNEEGLHARPAGLLVKTVGGFQSQITIQYNGKSANAKSIMSIMSLGITKDAEVVLKAEGSDAETALSALTTLFNNKFNL